MLLSYRFLLTLLHPSLWQVPREVHELISNCLAFLIPLLVHANELFKVKVRKALTFLTLIATILLIGFYHKKEHDGCSFLDILPLHLETTFSSRNILFLTIYAFLFRSLFCVFLHYNMMYFQSSSCIYLFDLFFIVFLILYHLKTKSLLPEKIFSFQ